MKGINIEQLDRYCLISDNETEKAVLNYLWNVIDKAPFENYFNVVSMDRYACNILKYLKLACFISFFIRASDIVWNYDEPDPDRSYSFREYLEKKISDDEEINPYYLNVIRDCLQYHGLIELPDFNIKDYQREIEVNGKIEYRLDDHAYKVGKYAYFMELKKCFSVHDYLKSLHINTLTVLFSNIVDSEAAHGLANSLFAPTNKSEEDESKKNYPEEGTIDAEIEEAMEFSNEYLDFIDEAEHSEEDEDNYDDDDYLEDYEHEFTSADDFVEFLVKHADELLPSATYSMVDLYSFLNGDMD